MKRFHKQGYTLIELLIAVGIIGILSTILLVYLSGARVKARDTRRITDIKRLQADLELYKNAHGKYPLSPPNAAGTTTIWSTTILGLYPTAYYTPIAPQPPDGACTGAENNYMYRSIDGTTYGLTYCLGSAIGQYTAGYKFSYKDKIDLRYDINHDSVVSEPADPSAIAGCTIGANSCVPYEFMDVTNNGRVTSQDAACLFRYLTGLDPSPDNCSIADD